jgi:hypothetical protein
MLPPVDSDAVGSPGAGPIGRRARRLSRNVAGSLLISYVKIELTDVRCGCSKATVPLVVHGRTAETTAPTPAPIPTPRPAPSATIGPNGRSPS